MGRKAVAFLVSSWVVPISILLNRIVPDPYMDEIFHVPQAQQYCNGNFRTWDPNITTPPGLYFVSLAHVASLFPGMFSLQPAFSFSQACSTAVLRSTNGVLAVICSLLLYEIITHLRPALDDKKATFYAVILSLYPLHWFFSFLYYTDVASLTAVLAAYLLSLKKNYLLSALLGALGVLMRQTNIIWVVFIGCIEVIDLALSRKKDDMLVDDFGVLGRKVAQSASVKGGMATSNIRKRKLGNHVNLQNKSSLQKPVSSTTQLTGLFDEIKEIVLSLWQLKWELLTTLSPFLLVLVAFVAFVCWNGSIVLGAKEAHTVSPHFAQLLYFGLVSALFMAPVLFNPGQVVHLAHSFQKNKLLTFSQWLIALTFGLLSVHFFSIAHPYLLADNRHYPFYLWRKVINFCGPMKYLLVPIYVYSWFSIANILAQTQKKAWLVVFFLACASTLIPTPLIEFRYYTIPFFIIILHSQIKDDRCWLRMGVLYIVINFFTMFMFLFRPFSWKHEAGIQRFIW